MSYVIVAFPINNLNGGYEYSDIMPAEQYWQEKEEGSWQHSKYEPIFFETMEEAKAFLKRKKETYMVCECTKPGFEGLFIAERNDQNICSQPSIYDILFVGTYDECKEHMKELEKELE